MLWIDPLALRCQCKLETSLSCYFYFSLFFSLLEVTELMLFEKFKQINICISVNQLQVQNSRDVDPHKTEQQMPRGLVDSNSVPEVNRYDHLMGPTSSGASLMKPFSSVQQNSAVGPVLAPIEPVDSSTEQGLHTAQVQHMPPSLPSAEQLASVPPPTMQRMPTLNLIPPTHQLFNVPPPMHPSLCKLPSQPFSRPQLPPQTSSDLPPMSGIPHQHHAVPGIVSQHQPLPAIVPLQHQPLPGLPQPLHQQPFPGMPSLQQPLHSMPPPQLPLSGASMQQPMQFSNLPPQQLPSTSVPPNQGHMYGVYQQQLAPGYPPPVQHLPSQQTPVSDGRVTEASSSQLSGSVAVPSVQQPYIACTANSSFDFALANLQPPAMQVPNQTLTPQVLQTPTSGGVMAQQSVPGLPPPFQQQHLMHVQSFAPAVTQSPHLALPVSSSLGSEQLSSAFPSDSLQKAMPGSYYSEAQSSAFREFLNCFHYFEYSDQDCLIMFNIVTEDSYCCHYCSEVFVNFCCFKNSLA